MSADTPRRLGRGLEALISTARQQRQAPASEGSASVSPEAAGHALQRVRIADIAPNRYQPRRDFPDSELAELTASLASSGLLQPITVRPSATGFELVAGERRLRAATRLGWTEIPAVIRKFDDREMLTLALVENLQRSDLNPLEEAEGYQRLVDEFGLTQQQVADVVGKDRTTITNLLRVLGLQPAVREMLAGGQISAGHARALLAVRNPTHQLRLAREVVALQLSVRDVETRARTLSGKTATLPRTASKHQAQLPGDPAIRDLEERLRRHLQTDVQVQATGQDRGVVRISFYGPDDLERLLELILGRARSDFDE